MAIQGQVVRCASRFIKYHFGPCLIKQVQHHVLRSWGLKKQVFTILNLNLQRNYFVNGFALHSDPCQIPSAYYLTDVFVELDYQLQRKVFHPSIQRNETRAKLAGCEGVKAKRCLQSLRTLWRSSKSRGLDDRVTHLKSFLLPSPERRQRRGDHGAFEDDRASDPEGHVSDHNDDAGDHDGEEQGDVSADENEERDRGDDGDVSADEDVQAGAGSDSESGEHMDSQDDVSRGGNDTGSEEENAGPGPCEKSDSDDGECGADDGAVACSQGSHGSLSADTLRLPGAPTESDASSVSSGQDAVDEQGESDVEVVGGEEEDQRDSQVPGAGWMGRGMMYWRYLETEEKESERREKELIKILFDIKDGLCMALGSEEVNKHWPGYQFMCHQNLIHYGESIFDRLVDKDFFLRWAHTLNPNEKDRFLFSLDPCSSKKSKHKVVCEVGAKILVHLLLRWASCRCSTYTLLSVQDSTPREIQHEAQASGVAV